MDTLFRRGLRRTAFAAALLTIATPAWCADAGTSIASQCAGPEYRQLDYWIGEWQVRESSDPQGPSVGRARVEAVAQGCALYERYEQTDGLIGESLLSWDPVRKAWQQTWITNRGSFMAIAGTLADGRLVLEGDVHMADGRTVKQRITWQPQGEAVRESALLSKDGGASWEPAFDVLFVKRADATR